MCVSLIVSIGVIKHYDHVHQQKKSEQELEAVTWRQ